MMKSVLLSDLFIIKISGMNATANSTVFISYSHKDKRFEEELSVHLKPLKQENLLMCWSDKDMEDGSLWKEKIEEALVSAKVAVLLISPNFFNSQFIADNELPLIYDSAASGKLTLLWIPLSASNVHHTKISEFQSAHDPSVPLDSLTRSKRNMAYVKICDKILNALGRDPDQSPSILSERPVKSMKTFDIDPRIRSTMNAIESKQSASPQRNIGIDQLIIFLDNLFERMTFRGEPKIEMCKSQRWTDRVHTARLTYEALFLFQPLFEQNGTAEQRKIYRELLLNISKYIDEMVSGLFEQRKVELTEVDHLLGTPAFVTRFKENQEKRFPISATGETSEIDPAIATPINKYLKRVITSSKKLLNTTSG